MLAADCHSNQLEEQKLNLPVLKYKRLTNLPFSVKMNVKSQIIETELSTLKKIKGSILDNVFSGKTMVAVDEQNYACIDSEP